MTRIIFWGVGLLAFAWNAMGCANLFIQMDSNAVANLPEAYQTYVLTRPGWATAGFAASVIAGVMGAILHLLRHPVAANAFWLSCFGAALVVVSALGSGSTQVLAPSAMSVLLAGGFAMAARGYLKR